MAERVIFHIDVNSAFLSWTAAWRVHVLGSSVDLREIPAVIANHANVRTSIVLAKSIPAKKCGVKTGEPLGMARDKCPGLVVAEPDYELYVTASRKLISLLQSVSPCVEQYSIDEAWVDMTGTQGLYGPPVLAAEQLKARIRNQLGFTVNIGVSSNKLLAKMAGDFEKPDKVHTLFPSELADKLWPLGVRELFMIGPTTERKLAQMGIRTIGELAHADPVFLRKKLGKQAQTLWQFANGRDSAALSPAADANKSYGNAMTTPSDVTDFSQAQQVLLSLCETVGMRLRRDGQAGACVTVQLRDKNFSSWSRQQMLSSVTNVTAELYDAACRILRLMWNEDAPLRQLGVQVTRLSDARCRQCSLFDQADYARLEKLDTAVDAIREKFGEQAIIRGTFLKGEIGSMAGGLHKERRTGITKPVDDPEARMREKFAMTVAPDGAG